MAYDPDAAARNAREKERRRIEDEMYFLWLKLQLA